SGEIGEVVAALHPHPQDGGSGRPRKCPETPEGHRERARELGFGEGCEPPLVGHLCDVADEAQRDVPVGRRDSPPRHVERGEPVGQGGDHLRRRDDGGEDPPGGDHPLRHQAPVIANRASCKAAVVEKVRTRSRSPANVNVRAAASSGVATPITTVPAGCSIGSGPAEPVTAIATSTARRDRAPRAISTATRSLTTPWETSTPSRSRFRSSTYATIPPRKYFEAPGSAVRRAATRPAVMDSALPIVQPFSSSRAKRTDSIVSESTATPAGPRRLRTSSSIGAIAASASASLAALAVIRTLISPPEARKAIDGFEDSNRSSRRSPTHDSGRPHVRSTRLTSAPSSPAARRRRGRTSSTRRCSISSGTPGMAKIHFPACSNASPGAVPLGLG